MTESKQINSAGNALSIAGLVIGIVALLFSFIPCMGMYAAYPGGVAIILSGIGLYLNVQHGSPLGLPIVALSLSVVAVCLAALQYVAMNETFNTIDSTVNSTITGYGNTIQQQLDSINNNPEIMLDINEKIDSFIEQASIDTLE